MVPGAFQPPGVVGPGDADSVINNPVTYSVALLRKPANGTRNGWRKLLAQDFVDFVRSPDGQMAYTDGGFIDLTQDELDAGEYNSFDKDDALVTTPRDGGC